MSVANDSGAAVQRVTWRWLVVALLVIGLDQYTKLLVTAKFALFERAPVLLEDEF